MKRILSVAASFLVTLGTSLSFAQTDADNFYKSTLVNMKKVSFSNQYKMKVAGNLFLPKDMKAGETYPAIIVGHPMGSSQGTKCKPLCDQDGRTRFRHPRHRPVLLGRE